MFKIKYFLILEMKAGYVFYNSYGSVDTQNKNKVPVNVATEYPRGLYVGESLNPSVCQPNQFICQNRVRDPSIDYFFGTEVTEHPGHFSRFGYPWCPNGYCIGNHPGRYNTPEAFQWQSSGQPLGMAPERFYEGYHVNPDYTSSPAYNNAFIARQGW